LWIGLTSSACEDASIEGLRVSVMIGFKSNSPAFGLPWMRGILAAAVEEAVDDANAAQLFESLL